ncbi:Sec-independent protein secretion pathway components [Microbacterium testaceum StLB037]|uniref:Sec-independent protein translocase protein TatA n=1 Tax=Microbacterium testaceum (strain StLB037) TaxID=979556 RepID=E8N7E6_MICTS|nr:twin-arginine translocase TatA/TatE family subunit [Microbacterium testaceum]BAJ72979.1 Sec-independent protein secretion pathway components [Microbacterium testaceum StLB037]
MLQNLTGWHALIVLAVIVLIFGAAKLPALARSLGQSVRILKSEVGDSRADAAEAPTDETSVHAHAERPAASATPVLSPPSTP